MNRGKWSQAGVPKKGWICSDIEDLGEPSETCQMCESQEIRFVHYMSHKDYPNVLACGCDCAGHMEGSLTRSNERDKAMRNASKRRQNFPSLKSWAHSRNGNPTILKEGMRVTVFQRGSRYKFVIKHPHLADGKFGRKAFDSEREAKLASFDAMIWLQQNWRQL
ncbi:hypothetical protein [Ruegeria halocynthiae]|uniref:hypothetical protein n=1 Tax=Ruegeria halocynthiae TaxID=985054 RepID=UPI00126891CF|nr:hypothetical protein [Ruegeria halocynthiae]